MRDFTHQLIMDITFQIVAGIGVLYVFIKPSILTLQLLALLNYLIATWVTIFWLHRTHVQDRRR